MRTKTQYREAKSESIPAVEAAIAPSPEAPTVAVDVRPESEPQTQSEPERRAEEIKADAAAEALKRQIEALRQSEALLRQPPQPQRPLSRDEKLAVWRQQGMPGDQLEFLKANPAMVDYSDLATFAANEALQAGHERGSGEHMRATKDLFDQHLAHLQAQAQQQAAEPAMKTTTDFFQPPLPKAPRAPASHYSAPVSRDVPNGGPRPEFEENPSRVHLSVEEKQIAAASGISLTEYAKGKIALQRRKAAGEIQ
jgi:hypothetical protein